MSIIAAGTTTTTALSSTGNTDGTLQLQVNGTTPSVTLNTLGAIGVGSTPGYGSSGQVLTSAGSTAAPSWSTNVSSQWTTTGSDIYYNTGNVGIGVTPSAWATYKALQVDNGAIANYSPTQDASYLSNAYYNAGWKYIASAYALRYAQDGAGGAHKWFTAASGTAGNAISFTQALTLDASSRLMLGTTTASSISGNVSTLSIGGTNASISGGVAYQTNGTVKGYHYVESDYMTHQSISSGHLFYATNTERFRIGPAGQIGLSGANYGTSGQVLTSGGSGAAPTWSTPSSGAMVYITSVTASGASSIDLTTGIDSTYDQYVLVGQSIQPSSGSAILYTRFYIGGSVNSSAVYGFQASYLSGGAWSGALSGSSQNQGSMFGSGINYANTAFNFNFTGYINQPASTSTFKMMYWMGTGVTGVGGDSRPYMGTVGFGSAGTAMTGIQLYPSTGTISGTLRLYGIKNS